MKKVVSAVAAVFVLALTLASCTGGGPKVNGEKFLNGLYHGDYASAKTVATPETQKQVDGFEQMMSMMQQGGKDEMKKVKVTLKEPKMVSGSDSNATIDYSLSSDSTTRTLKMVKQNGKWLAQWSKMDGMGNGPAAGGNTGGMQGGSPTDTMMAPPADAAMPSMPDTAKHPMH